MLVLGFGPVFEEPLIHVVVLLCFTLWMWSSSLITDLL